MRNQLILLLIAACVCGGTYNASAGFLKKIVREVKRAPKNIAKAPTRIAKEVKRAPKNIAKAPERIVKEVKRAPKNIERAGKNTEKIVRDARDITKYYYTQKILGMKTAAAAGAGERSEIEVQEVEIVEMSMLGWNKIDDPDGTMNFYPFDKELNPVFDEVIVIDPNNKYLLNLKVAEAGKVKNPWNGTLETYWKISWEEKQK